MDKNNNNNLDTHEQLLEKIMEHQKKREKKYKIKTGYLLNKNNGVLNNPYQRLNKSKIENSSDNNLENSSSSKPEPMFVVGTGKTYTTNTKSQGKSSKPKNKVYKVLISTFFIMILLIGVIIVSLYFLSKRKVEFICGNMEGINIVNQDGKKINYLSLRYNETTKFKIILKEAYSNSNVEVYYNNAKILPQNGYYEIKYNPEANEINIRYVTVNRYDITFSDSDEIEFVTVNQSNEWVEVINGKTINKSYDTTLKFKVKDKTTNQFLNTPYVSIYSNGTLLQSEDGVFSVNYKSTQSISYVLGSPVESFVYNIMTDNLKQYYNVTGLSSMGKSQKILVLPKSINDMEVRYNFSVDAYYNTTEQLVFSYDTNINVSQLSRFVALQSININRTGSNGLYSENGILYEKDTSGKTKLLKCPNCYGINMPEGAKILNINSNVVCSNAFDRLLYIKTVNFGANVETIEPLIFGSTHSIEGITFSASNNNHFTIVDNVIYSKDMTKIVTVLNNRKEFVVNDGMIVCSNAFSNSGITKLTFNGTATIEDSGIASIQTLTELIAPSNLSSIDTMTLFNNVSLSILNLSKSNNILDIKANAFWSINNLQYIVVKDQSLLDQYLAKCEDNSYLSSIISKFITLNNYQNF